MMKRITLIVLVVLFLAFVTSCVGPVEYWPTEGWRTSTPEEQGMDRATLDKLMACIDEHDVPIDSILVVSHSYLVLEEYGGYLYDEDMPRALQGVSRGFVSALIGIAIREGFIDSLEQKMVDFFPEKTIQNLDSRKQNITLKHMLTMSTGLEWNEMEGDPNPYQDPESNIRQTWGSNDPIQFVLDLPMATEPGVEYNYNWGSLLVLSAIIEKATGYDTADFAREFLFEPLGISEVYWERHRNGTIDSGQGLEPNPRDVAKFGYLYLRKGIWDGEEIVPADYIAESLRPHYFAPKAPVADGYQWCVGPDGDFFNVSHRGQFLIVSPELDMVLVINSGLGESLNYDV